MSRLGRSIQVKFRLKDAPSKTEIAKCAGLTKRLIREGVDPEVAGQEAAERLFETDENIIVESEADTIETLLKRAGK